MESHANSYEDDDLLALSGLQHLAFCERQWALIHVEQIWADSVDTLRGDYFHERVDTAGYSCRDGVRAVRGARLVSRHLGIYGIADVVEFCEDGDWSIRPVEYKVGRPKAEDWDRIQLAAQAMCLEEMHEVGIDEGDIFYGQTRRRETVPLNEDLRSKVRELSFRAHELFEGGITPTAEYKPRCKRCSLVNECLPDGCAKGAEDYWGSFGIEWRPSDEASS